MSLRQCQISVTTIPQDSGNLNEAVAQEEDEEEKAPRVGRRDADDFKITRREILAGGDVDQQDAEDQQIRSVVNGVVNHG